MTRWQRLKNVVSAVWALFDPKAQARYAHKCMEMRVLAQRAGEGTLGRHEGYIILELERIAKDMREHGGSAIAAIVEEGARLLREREA